MECGVSCSYTGLYERNLCWWVFVIWCCSGLFLEIYMNVLFGRLSTGVRGGGCSREFG